MVRLATGLAVAAALSSTHMATARSIAPSDKANSTTPTQLIDPSSNDTANDHTGMQDVRDAIARASMQTITAGGNNNKGALGDAPPMPGVDTTAGVTPAHGQVVTLPLRMDLRCRWNYISDQKDVKVYRAFMRPGRDNPQQMDEWCDEVRDKLQKRCEGDYGNGNFTWHRCAGDSKDLLSWGPKGAVATWEIPVAEGEKPKCVRQALEKTAGGWLVDWMGFEGCYQAFGFEIEY